MTSHDARPVLGMVLQPENSPAIALGFRLPPVPGIPDVYSQLTSGLTLAKESLTSTGIPSDEAEVLITSLQESVLRTEYHRRRFDQCKDAAVARRHQLGGPVVADWHAVPPMIWEATAYLGAARTAVELLVYIGARRAGKSESSADGWDVAEAISPKPKIPGGTPPTRYDVPEVLAIRAHSSWFERLSLYRNVVYHRGLGTKSWGYLGKADTTSEASRPDFNAMLLPDEDSLRERRRPHQWTYNDGTRLDDLMVELDEEFRGLLQEILTEAWNCDLPKEGTIPREEQSTTLLRLPGPAVVQHPDRYVVPVFDTKRAARAFTDIPIDELELRAVRPTDMGERWPSFLLPTRPDLGELPWEVHLHSFVKGALEVLVKQEVQPNAFGISGMLEVAIKDNALTTLYVWQSRTKSDGAIDASAPGDED